MSIMNSMKEAWHNHPYIIMGVGGFIIFYFVVLPYLSKGSTTTGANTDYASQLAAETALSQTQLAEQAQTNQAQIAATAATNAARATAEGVSNSAVAQANAVAIVSYDQTLAAANKNQADVAISYQNNENTDFTSLVGGLSQFGTNSAGGAKDAAQLGLWGYLTSIGAKFSATQDGINIDTAAPAAYTEYANTNQSNGAQLSNSTFGGIGGGNGFFGGSWGQSYSQSSGSGSGFNLFKANPFAGDYATQVKASSSPFAASDNLMASMWSQLISSFGKIQASGPRFAPTVTPQPVLAGAIQPII